MRGTPRKYLFYLVVWVSWCTVLVVCGSVLRGRTYDTEGNVAQEHLNNIKRDARRPSRVHREHSTDKDPSSRNRAERHKAIHRVRDGESRRLQFEDVAKQSDANVATGAGTAGKKHRKSGQHLKQSVGNIPSSKSLRSATMSKAVDKILLEADRYHMWWTGPSQEPLFPFSPVPWSVQHSSMSASAVFTMAVTQGPRDQRVCSSPNDLILFLGSLRRVYAEGDIVLALNSDQIDDTVRRILIQHRVVVYLLPRDLCTAEGDTIFCGNTHERVPASVFRYYLFEKWASNYHEQTLIMLSDFRDVVFQANPFVYQLSDWYPDYHLVVFQEFYPNMVIGRCRFNRKIIQECYGDEAFKQLSSKTIISSGVVLGTRDAVLIWTHSMTEQLQEAPGRMVETRCFSGGIDHGFVNYLVYGKKLRSMMRVRVFQQGEGPINSLGGLKPDTVNANFTGGLQSFWKVLSVDGHILNWNGDISPVVHQLDHFQEELLRIADTFVYKNAVDSQATGEPVKYKYIETNPNTDRLWQVLEATRCLFDCSNSTNYS